MPKKIRNSPKPSLTIKACADSHHDLDLTLASAEKRLVLSEAALRALDDIADNVCDACLERDGCLVSSSFYCPICLANLCDACLQPHRSFLEGVQIHEVDTWRDHVKSKNLLTRMDRQAQRSQLIKCRQHADKVQEWSCTSCYLLLCSDCKAVPCLKEQDGAHVTLAVDPAAKPRIWSLIVEGSGPAIRREALIKRVDKCPMCIKELSDRDRKIMNGEINDLAAEELPNLISAFNLKLNPKRIEHIEFYTQLDGKLKKRVIERDNIVSFLEGQTAKSKKKKQNESEGVCAASAVERMSKPSPDNGIQQQLLIKHYRIKDRPRLLQAATFKVSQVYLLEAERLIQCTSALHYICPELNQCANTNDRIDPVTGYCSGCSSSTVNNINMMLDITPDTKIVQFEVVPIIGDSEVWGMTFTMVGHVLVTSAQGLQFYRARTKKRLRWFSENETCGGICRIGNNIFAVISNGRVRHCTETGTDQEDFSVPGAKWLVDVAVNDVMDRIAVTDCCAERVTIHTGTGQFISQIRVMEPNVHSCPMYISFMGRDKIVVSDTGDIKSVNALDIQGNRLWRYTASHSSLKEPHSLMHTPFGIHTDLKGYTWVCDYNNNQLVVLDRHGQFVRTVKTEAIENSGPWVVCREANSLCVYLSKGNKVVCYSLGETGPKFF